LQRAIEFLATSPDPGDRNYAAQLRGQTALINTLITTQARIDEGRLRQRDEEKEDRMRELLEELKNFKPDLCE
jgi:hypothetical protein